jgi:CheY-like chemotaxis protein
VRAALANRERIDNPVPTKKATMQPISADPETPRACILLVEDEDFIRVSTAEIMRELGHTVFESRSAEEALGMLANPAINVLVADIGLPGMSGDVFAAEVRSLRPTIKIIFASGLDSVRADPRDHTGPLFLRKPYDAAAIEAALRKAFSLG